MITGIVCYMWLSCGEDPASPACHGYQYSDLGAPRPERHPPPPRRDSRRPELAGQNPKSPSVDGTNHTLEYSMSKGRSEEGGVQVLRWGHFRGPPGAGAHRVGCSRG